MTTEKNRSYHGVLELPNGEKLFRIRIIRPEKCMDCIEGTLYLDSLCNTVARFTIGRVPETFFKDGYDIEWFLNDDQNLHKKYIQHKPASSKAEYFRQFDRPVKLITEQIDSSLNLFGLRKEDIMEVSLQHGIRIYTNDKSVKQYKLIPETKEFFNITKCYFRWGDWGIHLITENDSSYTIEVIDFRKYIVNPLTEWKTIYGMKQ